MRGLNEAEHTALVQIAAANAADESGEHGWAYPEDQTDLTLAAALLAEGYVEAAVEPGSANPIYPLLDLQHGVRVTPAGLEAISRPYIVRKIGYEEGQTGMTKVLYGWSDGVVTWTMDRVF